MPAYLVHRIAGDLAAKAVQKKIPDENAYTIGLQGADIFFYYRFYNPFRGKDANRFAIAFHSNQTRSFFEKSMRYIKENHENGIETLKSYFCGYIVHYCVDKVLHPFVYARADNPKTHNRLEYMLDAWYCSDMKKINARDFDIQKDFYKEKLDASVNRWYRTMGKEVFGLNIHERMPAQAHQIFAAVRNILRKNGFWFKALAFTVRLFTGLDAAIFTHPKNLTEEFFTKEEYASLKQQIEKAALEAAQKIDGFLGYTGGERSFEQAVRGFCDINFKGEPSV